MRGIERSSRLLLGPWMVASVVAVGCGDDVRQPPPNTNNNRNTNTNNNTPPLSPPAVDVFEATPPNISLGNSLTLEWETTNAVSVQINDGTEDILVDGDPDGSLRVMPERNTTYALVATGQDGQTAQDIVRVTVTDNRTPPTIVTWTAQPSMLVFGQSATLSWRVTDADEVRVVDDLGAVIVSPTTTLQGTVEVTPNVTTTYTLSATNPQGTETDSVTVLLMPPPMENEPNDDASQAVSLLNGIPVDGMIDPVGDQDWYAITVADGGWIRAETTDGMAGCAMDTVLSVIAPDGQTVLFTDDDGGIDACSRLDPVTQPGLFGLPAGTYFVRVIGFNNSVLGNYQLTVETGIPGCGNGLVEVARGETCDDGNQSDGDGCSATCAIEPLGQFSTPGPAATITDGISAPGQVDFYRVDVTAAVYLRAETYVTGNPPSCPGIDTVLSLIGPDQTTVLDVDDNDGVDGCSLIDPQDPFSRLAPGTYWLAVQASNPNATIGSYILEVRGAEVDICGNGVIEPNLGETCDDGNTADGDGCDAGCQAEPQGVFMGPGPEMTFMGAIDPVGDQDFFRLDIAQPTYLSAESFLDASAGTCGFDTVFDLYESDRTTLIGSDDDDGVTNCSRIEPTSDTWARLEPGTYWLRVTDFGNNGTITAYQLVMSGVEADICGNGVLETAPLEECDDGNLIDGDGCSSVCVFEGTFEDEVAGNDTFNGPGVLTATVTGIFGGSLAPPTDEDWYAVMIPDGYSLDAFVTLEDLTGCPGFPGARLELFDTDGTSLLAADQSNGPNNNCGRLRPSTDPITAEMDGGTYYLRVNFGASSSRPSTPYFLHVSLLAPGCGNGVVEPSTGETCDDGNTVAGDGCDGSCTVESVATYNVPGPPMTFTSALDPAGEQEYFRIDVSSSVYLTVQTFTDAAVPACSDDTVIRWFSGDLSSELGSDDDGGLNACSEFVFPQDPFMYLTPGSYWLRVEEFGNNDVIQTYDVVFDNEPADICGNSRIEIGEQCDDGNLVDGDGCSSGCALEPIFSYTAPGPQVTLTSSIANPTRVDSFQIVVTSTTYIVAEVFDDAVAGTCNGIDTLMRLVAEDGTLLAGDDASGINLCSRIDPTEPGTRLTPGGYFLTVEDDGQNNAVGGYDLVLEGLPADICGNGIFEPNVGEQCDDGNLTGGDGCESDCTIGPLGIYGAPGTEAVFNGSIDPIGDLDFFRIEVSQDVYLSVETFSDASTLTCTGIDTVIRLFNEDLSVELGEDDQGGLNDCSRIDAQTYPWAQLSPGNYWIQVEDWLNNSVIPSYDIVFDAPPVGVCGNGVLETNLGEQCDDRNTISGDGCDSGCQLEPPVLEVEPNDTPADANMIPLVGSGLQVVSGTVAVGGDFDYFSVVVPANATLTAVSHTTQGDVSACASPADTRIIIEDVNGTQLANNDDRSADLCSFVSVPNLVAGTYFVRMQHYNNSALLPYVYFMTISIR